MDINKTDLMLKRQEQEVTLHCYWRPVERVQYLWSPDSQRLPFYVQIKQDSVYSSLVGEFIIQKDNARWPATNQKEKRLLAPWAVRKSPIWGSWSPSYSPSQLLPLVLSGANVLTGAGWGRWAVHSIHHLSPRPPGALCRSRVATYFREGKLSWWFPIFPMGEGSEGQGLTVQSPRERHEQQKRPAVIHFQWELATRSCRRRGSSEQHDASVQSDVFNAIRL